MATGHQIAYDQTQAASDARNTHQQEKHSWAGPLRTTQFKSPAGLRFCVEENFQVKSYKKSLQVSSNYVQTIVAFVQFIKCSDWNVQNIICYNLLQQPQKKGKCNSALFQWDFPVLSFSILFYPRGCYKHQLKVSVIILFNEIKVAP